MLNTINYVISSAEKLIIFGMKFSLIIIPRKIFQSFVDSPNNKQIDSRTFLITAGGFDIVRISTKCCRLIDFTPFKRKELSEKRRRSGKAKR